MQRRQLLASASLLPLAAQPGCTVAGPLRLGSHPWIGHEPLFLARDFGWLPPQVHISLGGTASDSLAALREGRLDGATITLDEMLSTCAAGVPLQAVLVLDSSAGADMLVARADLMALSDLRGHRLAVERSAVGELMLVHVLQAAGLRSADVQVVAMRPDAQVGAWRTGRIDAAITYEPTASRLLREGAHRLFDSRSLPETIFDVLALRGDALMRQPQSVRDTVLAHFRGLAHLRSHRQDALHRIATRNRIDVAEAMQALAGITLPDRVHNARLLAPGSALGQAAQSLERVMLAQGLLARPASTEPLFDPGFLPAADPELG